MELDSFKFEYRESIGKLFRFIEAACDHYEKSAPTVENFCDDLYRRLGGDADSVRLSEILTVLELHSDGLWEQPNYAANRIYKLQSRLGQDVSGHAGF